MGSTTKAIRPARPQQYARIAGALYLVVILGGTFAELFVRGRLVVPGDAAATAHGIQAHELLFRLGFVVELIYCVCNVPLILILYTLFEVVNRKVASMMALFSLLANAVESVSLIAHVAPVELLGDASALRAISTAQREAAAYFSIQLFERGFALSLVFFGFSCLALGYLIVHSRFFPRIIGLLLTIEGVGYLINSFSLFLAPALQARIFPYFSVTAVAEVALCLWLLVKGVNEQRWLEQAHQNCAWTRAATIETGPRSVL